MGDDRPDEEDSWFERLTDDETDSEGEADGDSSVRTSDQWEWVRPSDAERNEREGPAGDGPREGGRVWDEFASEDTESPADPDPPDRDVQAGTDDTKPSFEDLPDTDTDADPSFDGSSETDTDSDPDFEDPPGTDADTDQSVEDFFEADTDTDTTFEDTPDTDPDASPEFEGSSQAAAATDDRSGETPPPPPSSVTDRGSGNAERPTPPPPGDTGSGGADVPPPPPGAEDTPPGPVGRSIRDLQPLYRRRSREFYLLWLVAGLAYGLGDMLTTSVVFITPRIGESNPFVAVVLARFGLVGFVAIKLVIFAVLLSISIKGAIDDERLSYYGPPLLAILIGTGLTLWNLTTILGL
jgi:hypothetical protein